MSLRKIKREFKEYDGGVLKFEDRFTKRKLYFEMNYKQFKPFYKALKSIRRYRYKYFILVENGNHLVYEDLTSFEEAYHICDVKVGSLIKSNGNTYGICYKEGIIHLLKNMMCPEKDRIKNKQEVVYHVYGEQDNAYDRLIDSNRSNLKSNREELLPRLKQKQALDFNWDEAYAEGLRIFDDDHDQAESYADDMKFKETGKY